MSDVLMPGDAAIFNGHFAECGEVRGELLCQRRDGHGGMHRDGVAVWDDEKD